VVQNRPAHRSLILPKPAEAPKAAPQPHKAGVLPATRALATPKPLELPKLLALPKLPQK
jgi:hypothetical protein